MLTYHQTPVTEVHDELFVGASVRLFMKREDLNHPFVSGNKWWKLKYNLAEAEQHGKTTLLTFGGSFSNHIYATAAAAHELKLNSIGIIRGEERLPLNPVLQFAQQHGMRLYYVSREAYRKKADDSFIQSLREKFGDFYLIPEGGSNDLAVKGVEEFAGSIPGNFDYLCCPVGTGGTLAGLVKGLKGQKTILGISALKDGTFLHDEVVRLGATYTNWRVLIDYHFGGYAKSTKELEKFMDEFTQRHNIPLEFIYSGKMIFGIYDLVRRGFFPKDSVVLAIHTGGIHPATVV